MLRCLFVYCIFRDWNEPQFDNLRNLTGESLVDLIFEMAPKPSETFYYMFFGGQMLDLDQHIEMIMTDMGMVPVISVIWYLTQAAFLFLPLLPWILQVLSRNISSVSIDSINAHKYQFSHIAQHCISPTFLYTN